MFAGGVGKTTMADMLFNTLSSTKHFHKAAMVELDLEGSSSEDLKKHLQQLLVDLGVVAPARSIAQMMQSLAQFVQQHKVLLLLDNVNYDAQLDGLLPLVFSSGSRVIITSRVQALPASRAYKVGLTGKWRNGANDPAHTRAVAASVYIASHMLPPWRGQVDKHIHGSMHLRDFCATFA